MVGDEGVEVAISIEIGERNALSFQSRRRRRSAGF